MSDKPIEIKIAVPVLPCGHEASFEHELVEGLFENAMQAGALGLSQVEVGMEYLREVVAYFYIQVPTFAEMQQIALSHKLNDNRKQEVN